jgi:hypothetical protein
MPEKLAYPFGNQEGMTLRDYFAAQALIGIINAYKGESTTSATITAYEYADEMIKVRQGMNTEYN